MSDSIEQLMRSIVFANQQDRARFEKAMARTADAIFRGDMDELGNIVRDATTAADDSGTSSESGAQPVETGDADRTAGTSVTSDTSIGISEEPSG